MPDPAFNVTGFDGVKVFVQIVFPKPELLSRNRLVAVDKIKVKFNDSGLILSRYDEIPLAKTWDL